MRIPLTKGKKSYASSSPDGPADADELAFITFLFPFAKESLSREGLEAILSLSSDDDDKDRQPSLERERAV